ncbi:MAG: hypothetical protein KJ007_02955 [Burkholderiales bacterium]|nr:hypothetical protein [Burkholderiales bacterium]
MTARERARLQWEDLRELREAGVRTVSRLQGQEPSPDAFRAGVMTLFGEELLRRLLPGITQETRR